MRRRQRRQRVIAAVVAGAVAVSGGVFAFVAFTGGVRPPRERPTPSETPSATPTDVAEVACGGSVPAAAGRDPLTFDERPELTIDEMKTYVATMTTSCGDI